MRKSVAGFWGIAVRLLISDAVLLEIRLSVAVLLILLLLSGCAGVPDIAKVTRIIDGDTIVIQGDYHVRYIGMDTPEIDEPFYQEAKDLNQVLVEGKEIRLEKDVSDKDKYDRLLRYVYVDSTFVNAEIVRHGYAEVYPKYQFSDVKYYDLLKEAETEAREAGKGIWASGS